MIGRTDSWRSQALDNKKPVQRTGLCRPEAKELLKSRKLTFLEI